MTVRHFLVVAAKNDRAIPDSVLIAPGGMASRDVCKESKPRPEMIKVLKVVSPPLGTCKATIANQINQVRTSSTASKTCSFLKTLDSTPVLSDALRWIMMNFSRPEIH